MVGQAEPARLATTRGQHVLAEPIGASRADWEKRESWLGLLGEDRNRPGSAGWKRGAGGVRRLILRRLAEWE